ncbi:MAG: hypothetical protein WCR02_02995 [Sphaerochaetaceae bacterium]
MKKLVKAIQDLLTEPAGQDETRSHDRKNASFGATSLDMPRCHGR